jgi:xanthine dehydrogenase accessory factor
MMTGALLRRAQELAAQGTAFVTATVVRAQRPTSVKAGDVALVLGDGTIEGFVGGVCAQQSVRVYSLKAIETEEAVLLRIVPDGPIGEDPGTGQEVEVEEGAVTAQNPCLSGGAIEIFLEPVLPAPRVLVVGDTPIAAAVMSLGAELGLELVAVDKGAPEPTAGDIALVVAAHGRDELHTLRRGLEAGVPYIGLVASHKRGAGVLADLRADGVSDEHLELIDVPAGIDIGARTPAEIALSILAEIVAARRGTRAVAPEREHAAAPAQASARNTDAPQLAVDPICGMTVAVVPGTPSVEVDGELVYFCCEGCATTFRAQREHAVAAE